MLLFLGDSMGPLMCIVVSGRLGEFPDVGCRFCVARWVPRWVLLVQGDSDGSLEVCGCSRYPVREQSYLGGVACVSRVLVLRGRVTHFVCWFGHGVAWLCVVCCLGYPVWMLSCFWFDWWFEWLKAIRAVEILSPVFLWVSY